MTCLLLYFIAPNMTQSLNFVAVPTLKFANLDLNIEKLANKLSVTPTTATT